MEAQGSARVRCTLTVQAELPVPLARQRLEEVPPQVDVARRCEAEHTLVAKVDQPPQPRTQRRLEHKAEHARVRMRRLAHARELVYCNAAVERLLMRVPEVHLILVLLLVNVAERHALTAGRAQPLAEPVGELTDGAQDERVCIEQERALNVQRQDLEGEQLGRRVQLRLPVEPGSEDWVVEVAPAQGR